MKTEEIKELFTRFESIVCDYNGVECWSARELQKLLGYTKWEKFRRNYRVSFSPRGENDKSRKRR